MPTKSTGKGRGGKRPGAGRGAGFCTAPATREKIRSGMLLDVAEKIAAGELKGDPKRLSVRLTAALGLLKKTLPDLSATDITSKGERIVVELQQFKRPSPSVDSTVDDAIAPTMDKNAEVKSE